MLGANELKRKAMIMIDGEPYQVLEVFFATPSARGASTMVRAKVRNLLNGAVHDKNFKASEKFEEPDIDVVQANYLYKEGQEYCFMDQVSFEIISIPESIVSEMTGYLHEQLEVKVVKYDGAPISIDLPVYVNLKVDEAEPGIKGSSKNAVLETGKVVRVPGHISVGDIIKVNTETGEFIGRA